mmetsp:Transcript_23939/g.43945  ORF Transcript_23939/g.43945 Transcript_23939/m.43945 type:complete len:1024 (+) Transcript_23939:50-3121(+)
MEQTITDRLSGLYKRIGSLKLRLLVAEPTERRVLQELLNQALAEEARLSAKLAHTDSMDECADSPIRPPLLTAAGSSYNDSSTDTLSPSCQVSPQQEQVTPPSDCQDELKSASTIVMDGRDELQSASTIVALEDNSIDCHMQSIAKEVELDGTCEARTVLDMQKPCGFDAMGGLAEAVAAALAAATAAAELHLARLEENPSDTLADTVQTQALSEGEPERSPSPSEPASVAELQGRFEEVLAAASGEEEEEEVETARARAVGPPPQAPLRATTGGRSYSPHLSAAATMERCRSLAELDPDALRGIVDLVEALEKDAQTSHKEREAMERRARRLDVSLQSMQARCKRLERAEHDRSKAEEEVVRLRKALSSRLAKDSARRHAQSKEVIQNAACGVSPRSRSPGLRNASQTGGIVRNMSSGGIRDQPNGQPVNTRHFGVRSAWPKVVPSSHAACPTNGGSDMRSQPSCPSSTCLRTASSEQPQQAEQMDKQTRVAMNGMPSPPPRSVSEPDRRSNDEASQQPEHRPAKADHGRAFLWEMPPAGDSILVVTQADRQIPGSAGTGGAPAELHLADLGGTTSAHATQVQDGHALTGAGQDARISTNCSGTWGNNEESGFSAEGRASAGSDTANEPILPPTPPGGDARDGLFYRHGSTLFARDWHSGLHGAERSKHGATPLVSKQFGLAAAARVAAAAAQVAALTVVDGDEEAGTGGSPTGCRTPVGSSVCTDAAFPYQHATMEAAAMPQPIDFSGSSTQPFSFAVNSAPPAVRPAPTSDTGASASSEHHKVVADSPAGASVVNQRASLRPNGDVPPTPAFGVKVLGMDADAESGGRSLVFPSPQLMDPAQGNRPLTRAASAGSVGNQTTRQYDRHMGRERAEALGIGAPAVGVATLASTRTCGIPSVNHGSADVGNCGGRQTPKPKMGTTSPRPSSTGGKAVRPVRQVPMTRLAPSSLVQAQEFARIHRMSSMPTDAGRAQERVVGLPSEPIARLSHRSASSPQLHSPNRPSYMAHTASSRVRFGEHH